MLLALPSFDQQQCEISTACMVSEQVAVRTQPARLNAGEIDERPPAHETQQGGSGPGHSSEYPHCPVLSHGNGLAFQYVQIF